MHTSDHHAHRCDLIELTWGTVADAVRLDCQRAPRHWAYAWIEERVSRICIDGKVDAIADLGGGGIRNDFTDRLSRYTGEMLVVDKIGVKDDRKGNIRQMVCNMENGLSVLRDASVDILVSASALEHLTAEGQRGIFREIARVLKPGGYFCGTVSYITGLTTHTLAVIKADPAFKDVGSEVFVAVNIHESLNCAGISCHNALDPDRFPGFVGFAESALLEDKTLLHHLVGSYGDVHCTKEVDELRLKSFECGLFFRKASGGEASNNATEDASGREVFSCSAMDNASAYCLNTYPDDGNSDKSAIEKSVLFKYATIADHASVSYFSIPSAVSGERDYLLELDFPVVAHVSCQWKIMIQDAGCNTLASLHPPYMVARYFDYQKIRLRFTIQNPEISEIRIVFCPEFRAGEGLLPSRIRIEEKLPQKKQR